MPSLTKRPLPARLLAVHIAETTPRRQVSEGVGAAIGLIAAVVTFALLCYGYGFY